MSHEAGFGDHGTVTGEHSHDHDDHEHDHDHDDHDSHEHSHDAEHRHDTEHGHDSAPDGELVTESAGDDRLPDYDATTVDPAATTVDGEVVLLPVEAEGEPDQTPVPTGDVFVVDTAGETGLEPSSPESSSLEPTSLEPAPLEPIPLATPAATDSATSSDTGTTKDAATDSDTEWRELQGRFVDDPAAAVREAGNKVEQALADLRAKAETGSTEDLRTAFRRYRDLHAGLR